MTEIPDTFSEAHRAIIAAKLLKRRRVVEYLTSGTTWTRPVDVFTIDEVVVQGAGASGAGDNLAASGGGAGATVILRNYAVTGNITYAIGAKGTGVVIQNDGNDGGDTTWDGITAGGGKKGKKNASTPTGGNGGSTANLSATTGGASTGAPGDGATRFDTTNRTDLAGGAGGGGKSGGTAPAGTGGPCAWGEFGFNPGGLGTTDSANAFGGGGASYFSQGGKGSWELSQHEKSPPGPGAGSGGTGNTSRDGGIGLIRLTYWTTT